ncbi:hypothetical protein [Phaeobacter phage MD18]|nr:hypothetical protein [Phaeobacter phage MD18]
MSESMTSKPDIDFDIDPFTFLGSTLGNAFHSGLSLEDVYGALLVSENERVFDEKINETIFERFDNSVSATIRLKALASTPPK